MVLYLDPRLSFLKVLITLLEIQLLILISDAAPTYLYHFCPNTTTYVQNSAFQANLQELLSDLSLLSSTPATNNLFSNATVGNHAPDIAYGLFLCLGDVTLDVCRECVKTATTDIVQRCPKEKQVITWYNECLLRYDNISFFSISATSPAVYLLDSNNATDPNRLDQVLGDVMDRLVNSQTRNIGPLKGFATGEATFTSLQTVYSLVQCTPDLSSFDCNQCLRTVIGQLPLGRQGARVLAPSCYVRYDMYPFYNGSTTPPKFTLTNNCNSTVWPGIFSEGISQITTTGFVLQSGESKSFTAPYSWIGRFWGRTFCSKNSSGYFSCMTGDCNSGKLECSNFTTSPTTFTNFSTNRYNRLDYWDVSVVNGYNLPMEVSGINCPPVKCSINLNDSCLSEQKVTNPGGDIVACKNSLDMYSEVFKKACPSASSNPFGDTPRTFTCAAGTAYAITFCPPIDSSPTGAAPPISAHGSPPPPPPPPPGNTGLPPGAIVGIVLISFSIICLTIFFCFRRRKAKKKEDVFKDATGAGNGNELTEAESLQYELSYIKIVTNNFSADNKIGQGGFGEVFKGTLSNGQQVAVKRLSKGSGQGEQEFKNEVQVVAKLQHRNLVRLLGYCLEKEEKILIYEYVPNESLDFILFDEKKQQLLDWSRRYKIIGGVARGILYLHEDSRLRIIHRDIKASNVLLDKDMDAKISDFGLARIVGLDESEGSTNRVVGTFGYMSPEYIMHGQFSVKSDVFSFGVLVLEIISGKKNKTFFQSRNSERLLSYAWKLWRDGKPLDLVDPALGDSFNKNEVIRCIHMGLLCVQDDLDDRPTMALVVLMLNSSSMTLPIPRQPAFFLDGEIANVSNQSYPSIWSANGVSISEIGPR